MCLNKTGFLYEKFCSDLQKQWVQVKCTIPCIKQSSFCWSLCCTHVKINDTLNASVLTISNTSSIKALQLICFPFTKAFAQNSICYWWVLIFQCKKQETCANVWNWTDLVCHVNQMIFELNSNHLFTFTILYFMCYASMFKVIELVPCLCWRNHKGL